MREAARAETSRPAWRWTWSWNRPAWLAPFAAAALVTVVTLHFWTQHWTEDQRVQEVVSSHVRSLMVNHLTDVASSDQHTVKPWFNGKLNFSPPVVDPATEGFPLIGGRLDYVGDDPAAALVYQRRKHYINLFISPANRTATTKEELFTRHGYNLLHWLQAGMEYWAVSDVNKSDLQQFVQLVRGEAPPGIVR
jgi:anti-sigma factor RsiW